jgi:hypothetical protein
MWLLSAKSGVIKSSGYREVGGGDEEGFLVRSDEDVTTLFFAKLKGVKATA